ncbi:MAG: hypothetical protein D6732_01040 [Methanobacteriota archaeon]|nr:MAG: hypothetical protein D6732_01040 [Euryarchaeota archaeon]
MLVFHYIMVRKHIMIFLALVLIFSVVNESTGVEFVELYFSQELKSDDYFQWKVVDQFENFEGIYELTVLKTPTINFATIQSEADYSKTFQEYFEMTKASEPFIPSEEAFYQFLIPTRVALSDGTSGLKEAFFPYFYDDVYFNENSNWSVTEDEPYLVFNASVQYSADQSSFFYMKVHELTGANVFFNYTSIDGGTLRYTIIELNASNAIHDAGNSDTSNSQTSDFSFLPFSLILLPLIRKKLRFHKVHYSI